jgi:hypothetical protein
VVLGPRTLFAAILTGPRFSARAIGHSATTNLINHTLPLVPSGIRHTSGPAMARPHWTISVSSSFASLVSAVESFTDRGTIHHVYCEKCKGECQHEAPGATERFRTRSEMYLLSVRPSSRKR